MSKFKSKLAKRIMAFVLSGAMIMSNMSAYAAELSTKETVETVETVEEKEPETETVETAADKNDNADRVDDADAADSGKTDTPQKEQTDKSEEDIIVDVDNKDGVVTVEAPANLSVAEEKDAADTTKIASYKFSWDAAVVKVDDTSAESGYDVTYDVELTYTDANNESQKVALTNAEGISDTEYTVSVESLVADKEYTYTFSVTAKAIASNAAEGTAPVSSTAATETITYGSATDVSEQKSLETPTELNIVEKTDGEGESQTSLDKFLYAPVTKGRKAGTIEFYSGDDLIMTTELAAENSCSAVIEEYKPKWYEIIVEWFKRLI